MARLRIDVTDPAHGLDSAVAVRRLPSLRRTLPMCTSMLRSNGSKARPSTRWLMSSRVTTRPAEVSSIWSRSNSTLVNGTASSFLVDRTGGWIDRDVADSHAWRYILFPRMYAPQHRMDPRGELARVERFRQVVVGADFESDNPVHVFAAGREQNNGHRRAAPQAAQDFESVLLGQHHVEDDELVPAARGKLDGAGAGMMRDDLESFVREELADEIAQLPVVVHDEDCPRHAGSNCLRKRAASM